MSKLDAFNITVVQTRRPRRLNEQNILVSGVGHELLISEVMIIIKWSFEVITVRTSC